MGGPNFAWAVVEGLSCHADRTRRALGHARELCCFAPPFSSRRALGAGSSSVTTSAIRRALFNAKDECVFENYHRAIQAILNTKEEHDFGDPLSCLSPVPKSLRSASLCLIDESFF